MAPLSRAIVFVGFMGAGKSSAARAAGAALGVEALDSDAELEGRLGMPIARYFEQHGEDAFRREEEACVLELLRRAESGAAIALGGGSVVSEAVRGELASHTVVWLDVDDATAWERVSGSGRPLARERAEFETLHARRRPLYEAVADAIVPAALAKDLASVVPSLQALEAAPRGTRLLHAGAASGQYPVFVGEGLLEAAFYPVAGRRFCVTDGHVAPLYAARLEPLLGSAAVMPGEASKTVAHAEIVWTEMIRHGVARDDHVVALGGGVVGDLAGFCAATYQRGIPVVQVPTSLVAQVDSAYGGKTGVDLPEAKNYVGAYHQPAAVLVDPATLSTLPAQELAAGYAEVLKTALISGGRLWERVAADLTDGTDIETIVACARTKLAIVAADERDAGARQTLNLGHTVGHAIETATGYARYRHGEAVALGLLASLRLSGQQELREQVRRLLAARGLPTQLHGVDPDAVVAATKLDKKRRGEGPPAFVLLDAPGRARTQCSVAEADLRSAVTELVSP